MSIFKEEGDCYNRAEPGEPVFTLRGQDYSAPALTAFWVKAQLFLRQRVKEGMNPEVAAIELRSRLKKVFGEAEMVALDAGDPLMHKFGEAFVISEAMERWPAKKLSD